MFWKTSRNRKSLERWSQKQPLNERIKRTRILVIDDNENEFPFKVLRAEGYSIDYWPDVKDLTKLESGFFDIIILDIGGVGRQYDELDEGVGVLKHIKKVNPSQVVVAYSGQTHESSRIPFFKLADQYVPKPANALTWKECIDDLIKTRLTVPYFWDTLKRVLVESSCTEDQIISVEKAILETIKGKSVNWNQRIGLILGKVENMSAIASIVGKILKMVSGG